GDGSVAQGSRMQRREPCQLCADVRRRMDQEPAIVAARECDGRLFARSGCNGAGAHPGAIRTAAVPLRKSTARCRTQDMNAHAGSCLFREGLRSVVHPDCVVRFRDSFVEVVLIASDFSAHVDFGIGGCGAGGHKDSLFGFVAGGYRTAMEYLLILTKTLGGSGCLSRFAHWPPKAVRLGFAERKPSGIL